MHKGQQRSIRRVIFGDGSEEPLDFWKNTPPEGNLYTDAGQPARDRKCCFGAGSHSWSLVPGAEIYSRIVRAP